MRRTLDRYLFTECLPTLALSVVVFAFVLLMHRLLKLSDLVVAKGVPLLEVARLLALALPSLMPLLLPVSLLLAVLLAMGRMSADGEIVAMRASGVGLAENLRPVLVLSTLTLLLTAGISLWAQPQASRTFNDLLYQSVKNRIGLTTETGVFTELAQGVTVYAEELDAGSNEWRNLFLCLEKGIEGGVWILARSGAIRDGGGKLLLDLKDGEMHQRAGPDQVYRVLRFRRYEMRVPLPTASWSMGVEETPTGELWPQAYGATDGDPVEARLELHRRLALPFACLVFGVLGACLGLHHSRGGRSHGVSMCLVVLLAYYALLTVGRSLGKSETLPPELAMWLPNLVLGALAAYAFVRKNREAPLPLEDQLGRWLAALRAKLRHREAPT
ncbi:MAG: LPS export ABC transporter permease LptF [Deferrisomatales bacterium]|nr:LPS export ABC transporter permease LptF [Deferrisomatales bacterium]